MQSTIAKLIITRFAREFTRRKLIPFVGVVVLFFILILTMFVLGRYACWFDRVLGYPTSKPSDYRTPPWFYFDPHCDETPQR